MDAISFVLGINSAQLRSTQLKELINKNVLETVKGAKTVVTIYYQSNDNSHFTLSRR